MWRALFKIAISTIPNLPCIADVNFLACVWNNIFHMSMYRHTCIFMKSSIYKELFFQSLLSKIGVGIAPSIFGLVLIVFLEKSSSYRRANSRTNLLETDTVAKSIDHMLPMPKDKSSNQVELKHITLNRYSFSCWAWHSALIWWGKQELIS